MDAITQVPVPANEPVHDYAPKSPERTRLRTELASLADHPIDLPHVIGGRHRMGDGERIDVVQPHRHAARLGTLTNATHADAAAAVEAAMSAKSDWAALPFDERAAVFLRAADLLAGPWREKIAAATMLGRSRSVARGNGTGSTTARWTVSSTRSRRSTSPRSPAICRPPRL